MVTTTQHHTAITTTATNDDAAELTSDDILTTVTSSMGAAWCSSNAAQSTWSPCAAMCRGLSPFFVFDVSWASWLINICTTALCPLRLAQCSGVRPSCSQTHTYTPSTSLTSDDRSVKDLLAVQTVRRISLRWYIWWQEKRLNLYISSVKLSYSTVSQHVGHYSATVLSLLRRVTR